ncbi:hypothetical protein [Amycolatopsis aidingensis]|uniref:hypothetical protein n=1 Tax=Amycolatopsis aidingensis TaxID=2842453 RepID=UPI001C0DB3EA|nr:hypothetical protein [Amycolatopsis aidingensis]
MGGNEGFSYSTAGLESVVSQLREGARHLDEANEAAVEMVDAGGSSEIVGKALADLLMSSVNSAATMDNAAGKVDAAKGSYHDIENTNEGAMRKKQHDIMEDYPDVHDMNVPLN